MKLEDQISLWMFRTSHQLNINANAAVNAEPPVTEDDWAASRIHAINL